MFWPVVAYLRSMLARHRVDLALLIAVAIAYAGVAHCGYIWDDDDYVTRNSHLRTSAGLVNIWTKLGATPQYYPLVFTTFWIEYQLWGLNPLGFHLVNVGLHALTTLMLYRLLRVLGVEWPWFAALLFAVHPVHVESVAWVTERKNVLSALFYVWSARVFLTCWGRGIENNSPAAWWRGEGFRYDRYAAATGLFVAALLSKSVTASLPAALLVCAWWRGGRLARPLVLAVTPWLLLGAASGALTSYVERQVVLATGDEFQWTFVERLIIASKAVWFYLGKLLWPAPLVFFYPRFNIDPTLLANWVPLAAIVLLLTLGAIFRGQIGRAPLAAALFFGGTLFPALGFVNVYPMRYSFVADHFQYLASLGPICLVAGGLSRLIDGLVAKWSSRGQQLLRGAVLLWPAVLIGLVIARVPAYTNAERLYLTTLRDNPAAETASMNLGVIYYDRGDLERARASFADCIRVNPCPEGHHGLAEMAAKNGMYGDAVEHLRHCLAIIPRHDRAWALLSTCHQELGNSPAAVEAIRRAVAVAPNQSEHRAQLFRQLVKSGRTDLAIEELRIGLQQFPNSAELAFLEGSMQMVLENDEAARLALLRCIQLAPSHVQAHFNLAKLARARGDRVLAKRLLARVLELDPQHAEAAAALDALQSTD